MTQKGGIYELDIESAIEMGAWVVPGAVRRVLHFFSCASEGAVTKSIYSVRGTDHNAGLNGCRLC